MTTKRRLMYCALAMVLLLSCVGIYSHCQRKPVIESVKRDTVVVYDTVPHYYPVPKDSVVTRYVTRVLPVVRDGIAQYSNRMDTIDHFIASDDSVAVVVPITSKHYRGPEYEAWVSGYEASLDSIMVFQRKEYITEIITRKKPPNKVALFLDAGVDYTFNDKRFCPHAGLELVLNNHRRIQFAAEGGITKTPLTSGVNPYAGGKVRFKVF